MKTDVQIAQSATLAPITAIAKKLGLSADDIIPYGQTKAKISPQALHRLPHKKGKVILVTAINPTPAGEGKTTVTIGLADALTLVSGKTVAAALREPSLGPVFGVKGGAAGGGYAQVLPMEDINLHFTGDFHAIGAANNLLAALIDNHIYQGNELDIDPNRVLWRRALDMNDRQLRHITSGQGKKTDGITRQDGFDIAVASEVMACFCLADDLADLKVRLGRILVACRMDGRPVFARDLHAEGAMTALLKDALAPNLVQTIEGTPAFVHGGPFANIAHGCNSVIATKTAKHLADIVVTEAGFGADLGAEKFFDIKARLSGIHPDMAVLVATVRSLKYNGGIPTDELTTPNVQAVLDGLPNLIKHIDTVKNIFGLPVVVAVNRFVSDSDDELAVVMRACRDKGARVCLCEVWEHGGQGGEALAQEVLDCLEHDDSNFRFAYDDNLPVVEKITTLAKQVYGADDIRLSDNANQSLAMLKNTGIDIDRMPVCMAKTPYSLSGDPKKLGVPTDFVLTVQDITLSNGAGFVVVICGNIIKMPGLPKVPAAHQIDVTDDGQIVGLF